MVSMRLRISSASAIEYSTSLAGINLELILLSWGNVKPNRRYALRTCDFYKQTWFHHRGYVASRVVSSSDELLVIAASIGNRREQNAYLSEVRDVLSQTSPANAMKAEMWDANSDPCLQVADYCSRAIQRKWERSDTRSYELIQDKIASQFDLFQSEITGYF